MQILAVDIGTGTQDIFLYDSRVDIENGYKLVVPSPTIMLRRQIQDATRKQHAILLSGVTMGGGPCSWAAEDHLRAGLPVFATRDAAKTFNDDLDAVRELGIVIVSEEEAQHLPENIRRFEMRDFDFESIRHAFSQFGVSLNHLDAIAVAVFDHGAAPPDASDRKFRFDYLDRRIRETNRLTAFAYPSEEIPASMTRLQAVAQSAGTLPAPLVVMDTAPAAVLGATFDPNVIRQDSLMVANVGNFHTLAFRLGSTGIEGVFEHHTGLLDQGKLEHLIQSLAAGTLQNVDVFSDMGHGALVYQHNPISPENVVVTGPRRSMLYGSRLKPYFAVPFGDMMIAGCFGLLAAVADLHPHLAEPIRSSLKGAGGSGTPPWELDYD